MTFLLQFLFSILHLVLMVAVPVTAAVNVMRRPRRTGYAFAAVLSVIAGVAGGMWFGVLLLYPGALAAGASAFLLAAAAGEAGRRKEPFSPAASRALFAALVPGAAGLLAGAVVLGTDFYPFIRTLLETTLNEAIELQRSQGLMDGKILDDLKAEQLAGIASRTYMMPGLLLAGAAGWAALCLIQVARYSGVWTRDDLLAFRLPDWLMIPALALGAVTGVLGLLPEYANHFHVATGFVYFAGALYAMQGLAVTASLFAKLGLPVWLSWFALATLLPVITGVGIMDLWGNFRGRMARWGSGDKPETE